MSSVPHFCYNVLVTTSRCCLPTFLYSITDTMICKKKKKATHVVNRQDEKQKTAGKKDLVSAFRTSGRNERQSFSKRIKRFFFSSCSRVVPRLVSAPWEPSAKKQRAPIGFVSTCATVVNNRGIYPHYTPLSRGPRKPIRKHLQVPLPAHAAVCSLSSLLHPLIAERSYTVVRLFVFVLTRNAFSLVCVQTENTGSLKDATR